uniref:Uncharacterized protein n=1 Tax=Ditylenchus dipsaci TaxID=166011 RepID=A0A915D416_9BILA
MLISKSATLQSAFNSHLFNAANLFLIHLLFIKLVNTATIANGTPCSLPPDFWCDHPDVALACTGSSVYCDGYKTNRRGRPLQMHLAFESACPDSQQFVVHRLYPKVLTRREAAQSVHCHHGNRLLTCAMLHYQNDDQKKNQLLYCFMQKMMMRGDPNVIIDQCLNQLGLPAHQKDSISNCGRGPQATDLQKADETETSKILSTPRFVPFISINGVGHIHMQAHQMILNEKVKAWDSTVKVNH